MKDNWLEITRYVWPNKQKQNNLYLCNIDMCTCGSTPLFILYKITHTNCHLLCTHLHDPHAYTL